MMATLSRWEPLDLDLPAWMERVFQDSPLARFEGIRDRMGMRIEEFIEDGTLVIRAEMPDVDIDKDVDISVHSGLLHIKAERTQSEEKTGKREYRSEFRYGVFERVLPLPSGVSVDKVAATYKGGILEVRIPQAEESAATKVEVKRAD